MDFVANHVDKKSSGEIDFKKKKLHDTNKIYISELEYIFFSKFINSKTIIMLFYIY